LTLDKNSDIITVHFKKLVKTMISIRLMRLGAKKKPFYRIIAIDSSKPRESKAKDILGYYDPLKEPPEIKVDYERANYWLKRGAQASKTVQSLLNKVSKQEKLSKQHSKT
jgi:small subunit ribosomal protein S16